MNGHHALFVCDIVAFSDPARSDEIHRYLRQELRVRIGRAFDSTGVPYADCRVEDRGDGLLVVAPAGISAGLLVSPLAEHIDAELRRQHEVAAPVARLRLRTAVHGGEVHDDGHGLVGRAVIHAFRLLEAPAFKELMVSDAPRTGQIVSDTVFRDTVQAGSGRLCDPAAFRHLAVQVKETRTTGWVRLFGASPPAAPAESSPDSPEARLAQAHRLLARSSLRTKDARDAFAGALPPDVEVFRQPEPLLDVYSLLCACAAHPGYLRSLLADEPPPEGA